MFHQVSLNSGSRDNTKDNARRQEPGDAEKALFKIIESEATDEFFRSDIGIRGVNVGWLAGMRKKIPGRDVWMSGQQLVDEGSGIVDRLVRTPAR